MGVREQVMFRSYLLLFAMAVITIAGCKKAPQAQSSDNAPTSDSRKPTAPEDKVVQVSATDAKMNAAIQKAKSTVNVFIASLQSPRPGQKDFCVKTPIKDVHGTEHMWLAPVTFDGKAFHGTINNDAETVTTVKLGDHITVGPSGISDWMFTENGKLVGGYTIRAMRDAMSSEERAAFDKDSPFKID